MEKDKCDELKFYKLNDLPNNVIPYVKKGIENYLNNEPFSIYMAGKIYYLKNANHSDIKK